HPIDSRLTNGRRVRPDREGNLWVGTGAGLWRLQRAGGDGGVRAERLGGDEALEREDVWDILEDRDGNMWFATGRGLLRLSNSEVKMVTAHDGLKGTPRAVAVTTESRVWVATSDVLAMLSEDAGGRCTVQTVRHEPTTALYVDNRDRLWAATSSGIFVFEGKNSRPLPLPPGALWSSVFGLAVDRDESVWICDFM